MSSVTFGEIATPTTSQAIRRPSTFLSLVPVQSASYPRAPQSPTMKSPVTDEAPVEPKTDKAITSPVSTASRRHSSTSSINGAPRFLRLGPVHWGGDGSDDYAVEE